MKLFQHLGVHCDDNADNIKTECIWCGSDSLSVDVEAPHQFQCFKCKQAGNAFTYIRRWYESLPALKKSEAQQLCTLKKGIKPVVLRELGIKFFNDNYWFPVYNNKKLLVAIHKFVVDTNIWYSSPKPVNYTILGVDRLSKSDTIMVSEGHWDFLCLFPQMVDTGIDLLGTCGSYFSTSQLTLLKGKHIVLLYDNDIAGRDGIDHVARHLKSNSIQHLSLSYLDWTKVTLPTGELEVGFDVRDLTNVFHGVK